MPPTNNLSCFSIFLFRAEHDDWKNDLLFWKTNGWFETMGSFSSKWGSFISFCRSPKGVILNRKVASQKNFYLQFSGAFLKAFLVSDRLPPFFGVEFFGLHFIPVSSSHVLNISQTGSLPQKLGVKTFKTFEPTTYKFMAIHFMPVPCLLKIVSQGTQSWHRRNCSN